MISRIQNTSFNSWNQSLSTARKTRLKIPFHKYSIPQGKMSTIYYD